VQLNAFLIIAGPPFAKVEYLAHVQLGGSINQTYRSEIPGGFRTSWYIAASVFGASFLVISQLMLFEHSLEKFRTALLSVTALLPP
jgi:hypothetical protein